MESKAKVVFSNKSCTIIDIPTPNDTEPNVNSSFTQIDNLECFPEKVLLHIFSEVDDRDLLHLSDCSYRFDGIAKIAFKRRYASQYFVFDDDTRSKRKMNSDLFERFGRYANIKAVEVKFIRNFDENHWIAKLITQHFKELEKLTFHSCRFKRINEILSQHMNITHLAIRLCEWNHGLKLPNYRNLKQLEVSDNDPSSFCYGSAIEGAMRNNPALETLNLSRCHPILPFSIGLIAIYLKHLKELNLISFIDSNDWRMSDESMDFVADSFKNLELLQLTISNEHHLELVKRLSSKCKNLKHLELDHFCYDGAVSNDEIIRAATKFRSVESLELSLVKNNDSIQALVEYLPTLHRLRHLKVFMNKPQNPNAIIPSLLNASSSLKTINISTYYSAFFDWPTFFSSTAIFKEINLIFIPVFTPLELDELKQFQNGFGFVTNKEIVRCDERSPWMENDSIFISLKLNVLLFYIFSMICQFVAFTLFTLLLFLSYYFLRK